MQGLGVEFGLKVASEVLHPSLLRDDPACLILKFPTKNR